MLERIVGLSLKLIILLRAQNERKREECLNLSNGFRMVMYEDSATADDGSAAAVALRKVAPRNKTFDAIHLNTVMDSVDPLSLSPIALPPNENSYYT